MEKSKQYEADVFAGVSHTGDLKEALLNAFHNAMNAKKSDHVEWTLVQVSGKFGGFVPQDELTVTIEVPKK